MKRQTIAATLLAAALLIFVFFKFSAKPSTQTFNLTGEWQLDSSYTTEPVNDSTALLLSAMAADSGKTVFRFTADSIVNRFSSKDSTNEKYYVRDSVLFVDEGEGFLPYPLQIMTDSLVSFTNNDKIVFVLKRK